MRLIGKVHKKATLQVPAIITSPGIINGERMVPISFMVKRIAHKQMAWHPVHRLDHSQVLDATVYDLLDHLLTMAGVFLKGVSGQVHDLRVVCVTHQPGFVERANDFQSVCQTGFNESEWVAGPRLPLEKTGKAA